DLEKAGGRDVLTLGFPNVAQVLHLEEPGRAVRRDPRLLAPPGPSGGEPRDLLLHASQPVLGEPVEAVVENPGHWLRLPRAQAKQPHSLSRNLEDRAVTEVGKFAPTPEVTGPLRARRADPDRLSSRGPVEDRQHIITPPVDRRMARV